MESDEINYKTLREIQQTEKISPTLTKIYSNFYNDLSIYLKSLDERLKKESSQKQMLLKEEIQNTKKIAVKIYEQREKKILLAAISKARGGEPDLNNLVDVEKNLFDSILNIMITSRKQFLNKKSKEDDEEMQHEVSDVHTEEKEKEEKTNPIVMVTKDIPEFIGTDEKKYNLRKGDVLSLPNDMSNTLSKRGAAKEIEKQ